MGKLPDRHVGEAVVTLLEADGDVTDRIYNGVPDNLDITAGDILLVGEIESYPDEVFETTRRTVNFELEAVSHYLGDRAAYMLLEPAIEALDRQSLTVTGWSSETKVHFEETRPSAVHTKREMLRSIAARFRITVKQA